MTTQCEYPGRLIAFEGVDGSGKTHLLTLLKALLEGVGLRDLFIFTREPYLLESREALKDPDLDLTGQRIRAELEILQHDRAAHYREVITPALKMGKIVITDRSFGSTAPYQHVLVADCARIFSHQQLMFRSPDHWVFISALDGVIQSRNRKRNKQNPDIRDLAATSTRRIHKLLSGYGVTILNGQMSPCTIIDNSSNEDHNTPLSQIMEVICQVSPHRKSNAIMQALVEALRLSQTFSLKECDS